MARSREDDLLLFVTTSLDTHLILPVSPDDTVASLKDTFAIQHLQYFPQLGAIVVEAFLTCRKGREFPLAESMLLSAVLQFRENPCQLKASVAAAQMPRTQSPSRPGDELVEAQAEEAHVLSEPTTEVTPAIAADSGNVTPKKKKRRRISEGLSSPTIGAVLENVIPDKKKRRGISKGLSSDFPSEVSLLIKSKPQGEDPNQVLQEEDFKIAEKQGDTSKISLEKGTTKKKKKGKKDTSNILPCNEHKMSCEHHTATLRIATKENAIVERGTKLDLCNSLVSKVLVPPDRKKLLVLDINGLLADIVNADCGHQCNPNFKMSGKLGFKRPFCNDFLKFCFENFEVGVWSSRMGYNVTTAVNYIFGEMKKKLLFRWDQSKCTTTAFKTIHDKPLFLKDLSKLWENVESSLPCKRQFTPSNTLLIDDSPCKASLNPPCTAIFPYRYKFDSKDDNALGPGGYIRVYLERVATAKDVPNFVKKNPFGLATMKTHPEWKHYIFIRDALKGA